MGKFVIRKTATGIKFDLKAVNGEVIATSEVYNSEEACRNGIASVQRNAPIAAVEDQTAKNFTAEELLPQAQGGGASAYLTGFLLMMLLDTALG